MGPPAPSRAEETRRKADHLAAEAEEYAEWLVKAEAWEAEKAQLGKDPKRKKPQEPQRSKPDTSTLLPWSEYDAILFGFSGGKDSLACLLKVLDEIGDDPGTLAKVELWHHAVDGRPGSPTVFDWPCTESYCQAVADAFGIPLYFSWREGGILRDMQREQERRQGVTFQTPSSPTGEIHVPTKRGEFITRRLLDAEGRVMGSPAWPQQAADLGVRWCSSTVKVDVGRSAINNDPRFKDARVLFVTGERRQESGNRSRYASVEEHPGTNSRRRVDQARIVLEWSAEEVWGIIQRYGIVPHPCYWLGFGRASCETCIFSGRDEWATILALHPERFEQFVGLEAWARATIDRKRSIIERVRGGYTETRGRGHDKHEIVVPPAASFSPDGLAGAYWAAQALGHFTAPIRIPPGQWCLPPGGLRLGAGPV